MLHLSFCSPPPHWRSGSLACLAKVLVAQLVLVAPLVVLRVTSQATQKSESSWMTHAQMSQQQLLACSQENANE